MIDDIDTIIEAVREWQEAYQSTKGKSNAEWQKACNVLDEVEDRLVALRLPPVEEARP